MWQTYISTILEIEADISAACIHASFSSLKLGAGRIILFVHEGTVGVKVHIQIFCGGGGGAGGLKVIAGAGPGGSRQTIMIHTLYNYYIIALCVYRHRELRNCYT